MLNILLIIIQFHWIEVDYHQHSNYEQFISTIAFKWLTSVADGNAIGLLGAIIINSPDHELLCL